MRQRVETQQLPNFLRRATTMQKVFRKAAVALTMFAVLVLVPIVSAGTELPFSGRGEGTVTLFEPGTDGIVLAAVAQGNATHLGLFSRTESFLLDPFTRMFSGTVCFVAADGDQLVASMAGRFISATTATGTYTFIGGTGRFENATGQADFVVSSTDGIHFVVTFEGTLNKN
jgi:hypothetical protein